LKASWPNSEPPQRQPGFGGTAINLHDIDGRLVSAWRDILNVARDFLGGPALLLHRAGDLRRDARDLGDGAADLLDGRERFLGRALSGVSGKLLVAAWHAQTFPTEPRSEAEKGQNAKRP
jgi:hypothetical protein